VGLKAWTSVEIICFVWFPEQGLERKVGHQHTTRSEKQQ
jgi:hypothetical protein